MARIQVNPRSGISGSRFFAIGVRVAPNSPAALSGLRQGDVIVGANRREVTDVESLQAALKSGRDSLLLQIDRDGNTFFMVLRQAGISDGRHRRLLL